MIAGSLFSGVGGMDLGLQRAGFDHSFFAELDPWRRDVLAAHWTRTHAYPDVRDVRNGVADLLCGGFPCQDLSVAGKRAGLAGSRSGLFHEFARIADTLRPSWILLENVPGLLSSNDGRDMGTVIGTLADLGYGVAWRILDARYFGVPQRRRRVFIVCRAGGDDASALRALCESCDGDLEAGDCTWQNAAGSPGGGTAYALRRPSRGADWRGDGADNFVVSPALVKRYGKGTDSDATDTLIVSTLQSHKTGGYRVDAEGAAGGAAGGHLVAFHPTGGGAKGLSISGDVFPTGVGQAGMPAISNTAGVRRLTPVECERLMSWPDGWTAPEGVKAPDSRRYAACGDGVVSNVAEWIGRRIIAAHQSDA